MACFVSRSKKHDEGFLKNKRPPNSKQHNQGKNTSYPFLLRNCGCLIMHIEQVYLMSGVVVRRRATLLFISGAPRAAHPPQENPKKEKKNIYNNKSKKKILYILRDIWHYIN